MASNRSILTARIGRIIFIRWLIEGPWHLRVLMGGLPAFVAYVAYLLPPLPETFRALVTRAAPVEVCAPFGEHLSITLEEHTTVDLDSGACLTSEISAKRRLVRLSRGEAIFRVARDPSRPFLVETGPLSVRVLGTQFDVYRKPDSTRVAVIEGAVQISSRNSASRPDMEPLIAQQQIDVPDDIAQPRVRRHMKAKDFERITAWVHGDIELENQTLREAFDEFERYQPVKIVFADPAIGEMRFSGQLHTTELSHLLDLLKLRGIHSEYDEAAQQITLSKEVNKGVGISQHRNKVATTLPTNASGAGLPAAMK